METKLAEDLGEEIIFKLRELNLALERLISKRKDEEERSHPY
ncbi:MAG: hypothetical protein AABW89_03595 [Nanoarchaeota archaeon]